MSKKNVGYTLDLASQTLTITAAFADAANDLTSAEYAIVQKLLADFPNLKVVRKSHATPIHYKNSDGSITSRNKHNGLTIDKMESFIIAVSPKDDTDYLEAFYAVCALAKVSCASPYSVVSKWFMKQFPKFRSNPAYYLDTKPDVIDFSSFLETAKKKPSAKNEKKDA